MDVEELRRRLGLSDTEVTLSPCENVTEEPRKDLNILLDRELPAGPPYVPFGGTPNVIVLRSVYEPELIPSAIVASDLLYRSLTPAKCVKKKGKKSRGDDAALPIDAPKNEPSNALRKEAVAIFDTLRRVLCKPSRASATYPVALPQDRRETPQNPCSAKIAHPAFGELADVEIRPD